MRFVASLTVVFGVILGSTTLAQPQTATITVTAEVPTMCRFEVREAQPGPNPESVAVHCNVQGGLQIRTQDLAATLSLTPDCAEPQTQVTVPTGHKLDWQSVYICGRSLREQPLIVEIMVL